MVSEGGLPGTGGRCRSPSHTCTHKKATRPLKGVGTGLIGQIEFFPRKERQLRLAAKFVRPITQDQKEIDQIAIEIIDDFHVASGLSHQHKGSSGKRFDISPVLGQMLDDPVREQPFTTVPS